MSSLFFGLRRDEEHFIKLRKLAQAFLKASPGFYAIADVGFSRFGYIIAGGFPAVSSMTDIEMGSVFWTAMVTTAAGITARAVTLGKGSVNGFPSKFSNFPQQLPARCQSFAFHFCWHRSSALCLGRLEPRPSHRHKIVDSPRTALPLQFGSLWKFMTLLHSGEVLRESFFGETPRPGAVAVGMQPHRCL